MSDWKERIKKQKAAKEKAAKKKKNATIDTFAQSSKAKPESKTAETSTALDAIPIPTVIPIPPRELAKRMPGPLTDWEFSLFAPRLTSDALRISHSIIFNKMCRLRKDEIMADFLKVCLANLPPETSIRVVDSYKEFYDKLEINSNQQSSDT